MFGDSPFICYTFIMKFLRINKILNLLIEINYLAIVFFTPIFFALFLKTNNAFELNKIILFKILVLILLLLTVIKIIINFNKNILKNLFSNIMLNKYLFIILLFLIVLCLSTIFSIDPQTSFNGLYTRQEGLVSYLFYFLFFILLIINVKNNKQIKKIINISVFSSLVVCTYGLIQANGNDPFIWIESTKIRITSTLGQPNMLASYLLLVIPLNIYLLISNKKLVLKIIYFIILISQLLCLFFTYSISGFVGFIFGIIIVGIFYLYFNKIKFKKNIKYLTFLILFFGLLIINFQNNSVLKSKLNNLFNPKAGSTSARIDFWKASSKAISKKPLLGYGLETQGDVLVEYYDKSWGIHSNVNTVPNRTHNLFLDILLTSGIIGLLAYLALLYLFLKLILRNIRNNNYKKLNFAILLSIVCYLISLMFNFSFVVGEIYFWLLFAIIIILSELKIDNQQKNLDIKFKHSKYKFFIDFTSKSLLIIVISIIIYFPIKNQIKILIADYYWREIRTARFINNDFFTAYVVYSYLDDLNIKDDYYKKQYALLIINWIDELDQYGKVYRLTGDKILREILPQIKENNFNNNLTCAKIYGFLENYYEAEKFFKKNIEISPNLPKNYYELAKMYSKKQDYNLAIKNYKIALLNLPDLNSQYINTKHKNIAEQLMNKYYTGIGDSYLYKEDFKNAESYYRLGLGKKKNNLLAYKKLSELSIKQNNFSQAIEYNKEAMEKVQYDYVWPLEIAKIYKKIGEKQKALEYAQKAMTLNYINKEINSLVDELK